MTLLRPGLGGRPAAPLLAGRARLGQSDSVIREAAREVIAQAEPRVRAIISDERSRAAQALQQAMPFVGLSAAGALATTYLVPADAGAARVVGYIASAGALALGGWFALDKLAEGAATTRVQSSSSEGGGIISAVAGPVANKIAAAVVTEAEPRVRAIVDEERARLTAAGQAALPWAGATAVTGLSTMFLVPSSWNLVKFGGYLGATALGLIALWKSFGAGTTPAPAGNVAPAAA